MLVSLAFRNLLRNKRRSIMTGIAVASGVILVGWMIGLKFGSFDQIIDKAVSTRMGHLQVMPEGYLERPATKKTIGNASDIVRRINALEGVKATSPRVLAEGLLSRDSERTSVDLLGVDPTIERGASTADEHIIEGEAATEWCQREMIDALAALGNNRELFDRWCAAAGEGTYLPEDQPRAILLGRGVAKQLLVSVGDEVTVQVVRAVDGGEGEEGADAGSLSRRRLVVAGIFKVGDPNLDDRVAFVHAETLNGMLGTEGPNEIVILLDEFQQIERVRGEVATLLATEEGVTVHTWDQRNPGLANMIAMGQSGQLIFAVILLFLVTLTVVNATMMSVLERVREFGVMLAIGFGRWKLVRMVMTEVGILGIISVTVGAIFAAAIEIHGRVYGFDMTTMYDAETIEAMEISGVSYDLVYYASTPTYLAVSLLLFAYTMFLLAGLGPALRSGSFKPVDAMRER